VSRDPDLPSLRELGDRLGDAARQRIAAEHEVTRRATHRRGRRLRTWALAGLAGALVGAGAVGAGELFTGTGDPVPGEQSPSGAMPQAGVLADSAAMDPGGELPWALSVFVDDRGRECVQLGRLRGGQLGTVERGQFRRFSGRPTGQCGDLAGEGLLVWVHQRTQPAARTVVFGLSAGRSAVRVVLGGRERSVEPGALGGFVAVYTGLPDLEGASATTEVGDREVSRPLG
jgi:hypothetical protein